MNHLTCMNRFDLSTWVSRVTVNEQVGGSSWRFELLLASERSTTSRSGRCVGVSHALRGATARVSFVARRQGCAAVDSGCGTMAAFVGCVGQRQCRGRGAMVEGDGESCGRTSGVGVALVPTVPVTPRPGCRGWRRRRVRIAGGGRR